MTIRAGVAGAGVFGGYHANKYKEAEGADLVGIFDPDPERAAMAADMHGCTGHTNFDAFLEDVQAVTIAAPASFHYSLAHQALHAGRHCLVEKPIALDLGEADDLIRAARDQDLVLQIGHQERYVFDAFGLLKRAGAPKRIRSRRLNKFSGRAMDVSVVFDLMIHDLDLLNQLVDAPVRELDAVGRCVHGAHSDQTEATITFDNGTVAELMASRIVDEPTRDMLIDYDDGEVHINFLTREVTNTTPAPLAVTFGDDSAPLQFLDPLAFGTQAFLEAIRHGGVPIVTGEDGRAALDLALKIETASTE